MKTMRLIVFFLIFVIISMSAMADQGALERALAMLAESESGPPLALPAYPAVYANLMERNGRLAELGLSYDEGLVYAEAALRKQGIQPSEPPLLPLVPRTPPTAAVRTPGEFEHMSGVIIHYPVELGYDRERITFNQMLQALDGDPKVTVFLLVDNAWQQNQLNNTLSALGIAGDNFEILTVATQTIWTRDYGPIFLEEQAGDDTVQSLVDLTYQGRPIDDAVPGLLAAQFGISAYDWNVNFEGGNYMSDGEGTCFTSDGLALHNHTTPYANLEQALDDYLGCAKHIMVTHLEDEATTHIDMSAKLLDETNMIVGQYQPGAHNYATLEEMAAQIAGETNLNGDSFNVIRIPMPPEYTVSSIYGELTVFRSYTNSLLLNDKVLVPIYNIDMDAAALQVYEDFYAAKGRDVQVIPIDSEVLIELLGAVHCVTMERATAGWQEVPADDDTADDDAVDDDAVDDDAVDDDAADDDAIDDDAADDDAADDDDDDDDDDNDNGCGC